MKKTKASNRSAREHALGVEARQAKRETLQRVDEKLNQNDRRMSQLEHRVDRVLARYARGPEK